MPCKISRNGLFFKTSAFMDNGALTYALMRPKLAIHIARVCNIQFSRLPDPITPKGYNGQPGPIISHFIVLILTIDQRQVNVPFLITELGQHDVIIGNNFF